MTFDWQREIVVCEERNKEREREKAKERLMHIHEKYEQIDRQK